MIPTTYTERGLGCVSHTTEPLLPTTRRNRQLGLSHWDSLRGDYHLPYGKSLYWMMRSTFLAELTKVHNYLDLLNHDSCQASDGAQPTCPVLVNSVYPLDPGQWGALSHVERELSAVRLAA